MRRLAQFHPIAIPWLRETRPEQLAYLAYGFLPIASLSLALQDVIPLHLSAKAAVVPASAGALLLGAFAPRWGRQALAGLLSGIVAVAAYDLVRGVFVVAGLMADPIPAIGRMALDDPSASWVWGYVWRFVWNGGAMGIAFAMLPLRGARQGAEFGLFVCGCLFLTLAASPIAQFRFFHLTPANVAIATAGHLVYGVVLGCVLPRLEHHLAHGSGDRCSVAPTPVCWQSPERQAEVRAATRMTDRAAAIRAPGGRGSSTSRRRRS